MKGDAVGGIGLLALALVIGVFAAGWLGFLVGIAMKVASWVL